MKFAVTISSFLFGDFVEMNILMTRHVFGQDVSILVSDDRSVNSDKIEAVASKYGVAYDCSRVQRGHFANDLQGIVNSLVFAKASGCEIAVKVSFRFIFLDPTLLDVFTDRFTNHICHIAAPMKVRPGQLIRRESTTFAMVPVLSDVLFLRVSAIEPGELIEIYRRKVTTEKAPHASLIEALVFDLCVSKFKDQSIMLDELSYHQPGQKHRFLRKAQNIQMEYLDTARRIGITGAFDCREWRDILGVHYFPKPRAI